MKIFDIIIRYAGILIKLITWIVKNGVPFLRGIIEEVKAAQAKKAAK